MIYFCIFHACHRSDLKVLIDSKLSTSALGSNKFMIGHQIIVLGPSHEVFLPQFPINESAIQVLVLVFLSFLQIKYSSS